MSLRATIILSIFFLLTSSITAQKKEYQISLKKSITKMQLPFYCDSIIDNRIIKNNIGTVKTGTFEKSRPIQLKGQFVQLIKDHINTTLSVPSKNERLVFIIHEFYSNVLSRGLSESSICRIEVEFAQMRDSTLYSFGTYFSQKDYKRVVDSTRKVNNLINECLVECLEQFIEDGYVNQESKPILIEQVEAMPFDLSGLPEVAYFSSFSQLKRKKPLEFFESRLIRAVDKSDIEYFKIKIFNKKDRRKKKNISFIAYDNQLFINAAAYSYGVFFVKAKQIGRYVYFQDRIEDVVGTIFLGNIYKLNNLVLDTNTGNIDFIDNRSIKSYLVDHPEIEKEWLNSEKRLEDIEKVFIKLNAKDREAYLNK